MEVNAIAGIRNEFYIEVKDAVTGEIKQTAKAYNTVTKVFIDNIISRFKLSYIVVGGGQGTPSFTDTKLFLPHLARYSNLVEATHVGNVSSVTKTIRIEANELVGKSLTEVGFCQEETLVNYLTTHAMITDSEGAPISINKTATDIVDIYAKVYLTFEDLSTKYGDRVNWAPRPNILTNIALCLSTETAVSLALFNEAMPTVEGLKFSGGVTASPTPNAGPSVAIAGSVATLKYTYRLNTTAGNGLIGGIASQAIGVSLPIPGVWEPLSRPGYPVGTGDGVKTKFTLPFADIKKDTLAVYVDGVNVVPKESLNRTMAVPEIATHMVSKPAKLPEVTCYSKYDETKWVVGTPTGEVLLYDFLLDKVLSTFKVSNNPIRYVKTNIEGTYCLIQDVTPDYATVDMTTGTSIIGIDNTTHAFTSLYTNEMLGKGYREAILPSNGKYFIIRQDRGGIASVAGAYALTIAIDTVNKTFGTVVSETRISPNTDIHSRRNMDINPSGTLLYSSMGVVSQLELATGTVGAALTGSVVTSFNTRFIDDDTIMSFDSHSTVYKIKGNTVEYISQIRTYAGSTHQPYIDGKVFISSDTASGDLYAQCGYTLPNLPKGTTTIAPGKWMYQIEPILYNGLYYTLMSYTSGTRILPIYARPETNAHHFELAVAPAAGAVITADFVTEGIPKDINHILDLVISLEVRPG